MSVKIDHRKSGLVTVVDLSGKIILGDAANQLLATAKELIGQGERNLLLNLAEVSYVDSAGLGTMVKCYKAATESQGRMKLLNVSGKIRVLLRITKLQSIYEIFDDETAAINSFN